MSKCQKKLSKFFYHFRFILQTWRLAKNEQQTLRCYTGSIKLFLHSSLIFYGVSDLGRYISSPFSFWYYYFYFLFSFSY